MSSSGSRAGHLEDVVGNGLDDAGAWIVVLVDSVAEAHEAEFALLDALDKAGHVLGVADLGQRADDGLVGAAVQGTEERGRGPGHGAVGVRLGGADAAHDGGGAVLLVVCVQDEEDVQGFG